MPYRCVHCSSTYEDGSREILTGCNTCGSKFFFYLKKERLEQAEKIKEEEQFELTEEEKRQMEEDVREIVGLQDEETPIFLDFESVKVMKPGKYLLDLPKLFAQDKPHIYQLEPGKYIVDFIYKPKEESS
jgi:predicted  nucleic acid-binding Zn-ribbon protein